jgi:hypothetical protein
MARAVRVKAHRDAGADSVCVQVLTGNQIEVYPSSLSSSAASAISPGSPKARPAFQIPVPPSFTARTSRSALVKDRDILATHRCAPHQPNPCRQRAVAARGRLDRAFPRTGFTPLSTDRNRYPHNGGSAICRGQRMSLASQISTQKMADECHKCARRCYRREMPSSMGPRFCA